MIDLPNASRCEHCGRQGLATISLWPDYRPDGTPNVIYRCDYCGHERSVYYVEVKNG